MLSFMFFRAAFCILMMSKQKEKVFYAVGVGHKVGVYHTWSECKKQVDGVSNPKFRKFENLQEAEQFVSKWQSKGPNFSGFPTTPKQQSGTYCSKLNDRSQEELGCQAKGDTNIIKKKNKKKKKKKKKESTDNVSNKGGYECTKLVSTQVTENSCSHNIERIYYTWKENGKSLEKGTPKVKGCFCYGKNRKEVGGSNIRKKDDKNQTVSHSAVQHSHGKGTREVTITWDPSYVTNQQIVNTFETVGPSSWNTIDSAGNSLGILAGCQIQQGSFPLYTNYSSYQHPHSIENVNYPMNYVQGTYTNAYGKSTEIVNSEIWDVASIPLPGESCSSSLNPAECSSVQDLGNNITGTNSNCDNARTTKSAADNCTKENSSAIFIPDKTDKTLAEEIEVQILRETDELDENGLQSVGSDGFVTIDENFADDISSGAETVHYLRTDEVKHNINEDLKKQPKPLTKEADNENCVSSVTDTLEKIVDVVRVALQEIVSGYATAVGGGGQQSKVNDFSKLKVSQSRESRKSNSFSGKLDPTVAIETSTCNNREEAPQVGDAADIALLEDKVGNCERKVDLCIGKIGEILSGLTDIKNELMQLKSHIPRNYGVLTKEVGGRKFDSTISTSGFSRAFALNCDTGEGDRALNTQHKDEQRTRKFKIKSTCSDDDLGSQPVPPKRKRTWDDQSSAGSQEHRLDKEIKQERDDYVSFNTDEDDYVVVYTDGSCMYNGSEHAKAGIGIWFDDGHPLNVSRPLIGVEPTNNNAEIQAARIACELALSAGISKLKICTDSEFLINCITKWVHRWKSNGWCTEAKKPIKNRAELEKLLEVTSRLSVRWEKVAGHTDIKGNEMADRLANAGATHYVNR